VQSTPAFCSQTLCSAPIVEFIDANLLCWGGDVRHREAFQASGRVRQCCPGSLRLSEHDLTLSLCAQLSGTLRNATYPYLALVLLSTGSRHGALVPGQSRHSLSCSPLPWQANLGRCIRRVCHRGQATALARAGT